MRVLTYERDVNGFVQPQVRVTLKNGREFYLGNPFAEVQEAMQSATTPFTAHQVVGLAPRDVVVNPAHVALVEDVA